MYKDAKPKLKTGPDSNMVVEGQNKACRDLLCDGKYIFNVSFVDRMNWWSKKITRLLRIKILFGKDNKSYHLIPQLLW